MGKIIMNATHRRVSHLVRVARVRVETAVVQIEGDDRDDEEVERGARQPRGSSRIGSTNGMPLEAGHGSHEAFSRAFRDQFGLTPAEARTRASLDARPRECRAPLWPARGRPL
jgi:AraC-like DNA-binding protein